MSHIYQPVMLKVLLENGGRAPRTAIAKAFLEEDRSQVEYYETIVRDMPGRVLANHGIVERADGDYRFTDAFHDLSFDQRQTLIKQCDTKLAEYLEKRGMAPWQHRKKSKGYDMSSERSHGWRRPARLADANAVASWGRA